MLSEFEASLMRILINNMKATPQQIAELLEKPRTHPRQLVQHAVQMHLADGHRLCHLLCQYWEKPLVDISLLPRRFLTHFNRPIGDLLDQDLLPLDFSADSVTVVSYYVPSHDVLASFETGFGKPLTLYLADVAQVLEGIKLLRERVERFQHADVVDCGTDKKRFLRLVNMGWPASVHENFAGSTIRIDFDRSATITKTLEAMHPSEPAQLANYLVGKTMTHRLTQGDSAEHLVESFPQSISAFEGELKEAILRLRLAPLLLKEEESNEQK